MREDAPYRSSARWKPAFAAQLNGRDCTDLALGPARHASPRSIDGQPQVAVVVADEVRGSCAGPTRTRRVRSGRCCRPDRRRVRDRPRSFTRLLKMVAGPSLCRRAVSFAVRHRSVRHGTAVVRLRSGDWDTQSTVTDHRSGLVLDRLIRWTMRMPQRASFRLQSACVESSPAPQSCGLVP